MDVDKNNFNENVDEMVPETPKEQFTKSINISKKIKKIESINFIKNKIRKENNKFLKRRLKNKIAKISRKKNRKNK